jgi:hypothetical protein
MMPNAVPNGCPTAFHDFQVEFIHTAEPKTKHVPRVSRWAGGIFARAMRISTPVQKGAQPTWGPLTARWAIQRAPRWGPLFQRGAQRVPNASSNNLPTAFPESD